MSPTSSQKGRHPPLSYRSPRCVVPASCGSGPQAYQEEDQSADQDSRAYYPPPIYSVGVYYAKVGVVGKTTTEQAVVSH